MKQALTSVPSMAFVNAVNFSTYPLAFLMRLG